MKKILVAEDDKMLALAYQLKLTKNGFDVRVVSDGKEALEIISSFRPDLIILDLVMPVMDGITVLRRLKEDAATRNLPVMVASNLGQSADLAKGVELGAIDYIVKSDISMEGLIKKIIGYLK